MAQGDKCGNCERSLATEGCAKNICVAPFLAPFQAASFANRCGEVDPENTDVCKYYHRMHNNHGESGP